MKLTELENKEIELAHLPLDWSKIDLDSLRDPFANYYSKESYLEVLKIIREPKNFYFTCKYILNVEPTVFQLVWLKQLWKYPFVDIIAGRGASKSFTLALYHALRATITQGSKIIIASASFRQSKEVFNYIENIWNNAPVWRDLCGPNDGPKHHADEYVFKIGRSKITALPMGSGETLRGKRANYVQIDEFNSCVKEIFEVVLRGFTVTSSNPVENIKSKAKLKKLREKGMLTPEMEEQITGLYKPNQIILTGTAGWDFQVFSEYWKKHRNIIKSGGQQERLREIMGKEDENIKVDHKDYCVIRMPAALLPEGMMDEKAIANAKATMDKASYQRELGAIFVKDSNGFFPRSLIENASCKKPIEINGQLVQFPARIKGDSGGRYILGCDPASESDNLAIVILENHPDHNRVVYCWTVRRMDLINKQGKSGNTEKNYYAFIARKIRSLMDVFPIEYIALDSGGGGIAVSEALHDVKALERGEVPIWPMRMDDPVRYKAFKDYGYDDEHGLHIIEMVSMSCSDYVTEANHGMKKDMQNKMLIFPHADALTLAMAEIQSKNQQDQYDTLEEIVLEIESLKDEISTIQFLSTLTGKDKWDTPAGLTAEGKKYKQRKDRYSALLIANALARRLFRQSTIDYSCKAVGGFTHQYQGQNIDGPLYVGPEWFVNAANQSALGSSVTRKKNSSPFDYYR